jgi:hypothetical protein
MGKVEDGQLDDPHNRDPQHLPDLLGRRIGHHHLLA